mmetsp:Transcript_22590/g.28958  ORF Transcript_22590/g.28958 Transcript_22590/m.28958 type:complete len:97 (+) Transcript_22590:7-297(+)
MVVFVFCVKSLKKVFSRQKRVNVFRFRRSKVHLFVGAFNLSSTVDGNTVAENGRAPGRLPLFVCARYDSHWFGEITLKSSKILSFDTPIVMSVDCK